MGPSQESDCWPKLDPSHPPELLEADLHTRAWNIRKKVFDEVRREKGGGLAAEVWKDSLSDVDGFCVGAFLPLRAAQRKARRNSGSKCLGSAFKQGSKVPARPAPVLTPSPP